MIPAEQSRELVSDDGGGQGVHTLAELERMAQPLDEWCSLCGNRLATMKTADGVAACQDCGTEWLAALMKYQDDEVELEAYLASFHTGPYFTNRAMQRQQIRTLRRRNDGMKWGEIRTGSRCR